MNSFIFSALKDIEANEVEIKKISTFIHNNPEIAFEEKKACKLQVDFLKGNGFEVETPFKELPTAYKAETGKGTPVFCIMSEYDALQEIGHACGHNLIAASALAAGIAMKKAMEKDKIPGKLIVMGTPAEEGRGGKVSLLEKGAFEGIDAAILSHPFNKTITDCGWLSISRFDVIFRGRSAHAAVNPESGLNALDAMNLLFMGIGAWRQQLPESSRLHGVITKGGNLPNIIPDHTEAYFYLRAEKTKIHKAMEERFSNIVKGAALMTGCECELLRLENPYTSNIYNKPFDDQFYDFAEAAGLQPQRAEKTGRISSDFANVSQIMPCSNFFFEITQGKDYPLHSVEFRDAAATDYAFTQAMKIGAVMAATGIKYLTDKTFRQQVRQDFETRKTDDR